MTRFHPKK